MFFRYAIHFSFNSAGILFGNITAWVENLALFYFILFLFGLLGLQLGIRDFLRYSARLHTNLSFNCSLSIISGFLVRSFLPPSSVVTQFSDLGIVLLG